MAQVMMRNDEKFAIHFYDDIWIYNLYKKYPTKHEAFLTKGLYSKHISSPHDGVTISEIISSPDNLSRFRNFLSTLKLSLISSNGSSHRVAFAVLSEMEKKFLQIKATTVTSTLTSQRRMKFFAVIAKRDKRHLA